MNLSQIARIYHTIRYLKPSQVTNRLQRRLMRPRWRPMEAPPLRPLASTWTAPCERPPSLVGPQEIQVFQRRMAVRSRADWSDPQQSHLELYNLHYFDDLTAAQAHHRAAWQAALIAQWIEQNPPGQGPGWEPYPLSLRIVNWIKWHLSGHKLERSQLDSLATQVQALAEQLEFHLLANHLLANAKALVFAGAFFQGPEAGRWLQRGRQIFRQQVAEQILADGGHFELSPMYHSIILEDVLDVLNLAGTYAHAPDLAWSAELRPTASRMRYWLRALTHPDGQIAFFNDAALGIASAPADLEQYARRLDLAAVAEPTGPLVHLASSGYIRMQRGDSVVLVDVARVGPDYQPGHAHADTLSFEWSLSGQRVIVNSGTSCYGLTAERLRQRGTAAHSTVEVDGLDSSEVWSGFRVARRAVPGAVELAETNEGLQVTGSHNGYQRLSGRVTHHRRWSLATDSLRIEDTLTGHFAQAVARFHLHPLVGIEPDSDIAELRWRTPTGLRLQASITGGRPRCVRSTYHPQFGVSLPSFCCESHFQQAAHELLIRWSGSSSP